ncbi:CRISPR-associated helicase Cas3' [Syntrophomonas erecta]
MYYAHSVADQDKDCWQKLKDHLEATARLAKVFGAKFDAASFAQAAGVLHDIGKYSQSFQDRLEGANIHVDHSTAGAQEALSLYGRAAGRIIAYTVAGHHAGLPDYGSPQRAGSLSERLLSSTPSYDAYKTDKLKLPPVSLLRLPFLPSKNTPGFSIQLFIRFVYSCLVDADFLDTEKFYDPYKSKNRRHYPGLEKLALRLEDYLIKLKENSSGAAIKYHRDKVLQACIEGAVRKPGLFTLTVPTGGGKTLSSLSFALQHALQHQMSRVIYVIPYTSIIEQNADVFRIALGNEAIVEHHSNYQFPERDDLQWAEEFERLKLAAENWDAPIVVTTNVQFFESLFASKSSRCRKLHNIARSVIILDEAQMIPTSYLKPCLTALAELVIHYGCSVVLCTATQPAITSYLPGKMIPVELAPDPHMLYQALRRVQVVPIGAKSDHELAEELSNCGQVLCIVNTRQHALKLYKMLSGNNTFHLSARMCAKHRTQRLDEIRQALKEGQPCQVISTQLIEAGVDVDFPVVYRSFCGLDSLAQAAGRCNREGRLDQGYVYTFKPEKHGLPKGWLSRTAEVAAMVMKDYKDPLELEAIEKYFTKLYSIEGEALDEHGIMALIEERSKELAFPFREIDEKFNIIANNTKSIIIPYDQRCRNLIEQAKFLGVTTNLSRSLQPYTIQIYSYEYAELTKAGVLDLVAGQYLVLNYPSMYSQETGLQYVKDTLLAEDVLIV